MMRFNHPVIVLAAALASPTMTAAQQPGTTTQHEVQRGGVTVVGELGMYLPVGPMVLDSTVRLRGVGAVLIGGRISVPLHQRVALQSTLGWSPTLVAQTDWKQTVDLGGGVWLASLRSALSISQSNGTEVIFAPGLGVVHRYGAAWTGLKGNTDFALVLGASVRFHEPGSRWAFTLNFDDFVTRTGFTDPAGTAYGGRLLNELTAAIGVTFALARR